MRAEDSPAIPARLCGYLLRTARSEILVGENSRVVDVVFDRFADTRNLLEVIAGG
jgi:hypothetical protein